MILTEEATQAIVAKFRRCIDPDERSQIGTLADTEQVNRELAKVPDPEAGDVAEVIWAAIDGAEELLHDSYLDELIEIVEERWTRLTK